MAPRDAAVVSEEGERAARSSLWLSDPAGRACTARREPARGAQDRLVRNRSPIARRRRWSCGLVNSRVALLLSRRGCGLMCMWGCGLRPWQGYTLTRTRDTQKRDPTLRSALSAFSRFPKSK